MIPYIDNRLREWRDWRYTRDGYGYRTILGDLRINRGATGGSGGGPSPPRTYGLPLAVDPELLIMTDAAVRALEAKLQRVTLLCYVGVNTLDDLVRATTGYGERRVPIALTGAEIAALLGCHRDTVYAHLHSAHQAVLDLLNDYAAGVKKYRAAQRRARRKAIDARAAIRQNHAHSDKVA